MRVCKCGEDISQRSKLVKECGKCRYGRERERRMKRDTAKRLAAPKRCEGCFAEMDRLNRRPKLCAACRDGRLKERKFWAVESVKKQQRQGERIKKEWAESPMNDAIDMLMNDYGHTREEALRIIGDVREGRMTAVRGQRFGMFLTGQEE